MLNRVALMILLLLSMGTTALAGDSDNAYAVKGAGISSCSRFVDTAEKHDNLYLIYGGWIEGYITATNQYLENTFDLSPWQSTQLMLKVAESICRKNPEMQFHQVVTNIMAGLTKQRIEKGGKFVDINGDRKYVFQKEVIHRIKKTLNNKGFYDGPINSDYDDALKTSMKAFQKSINQKQTGLPDQGTLFKLFQHD